MTSLVIRRRRRQSRLLTVSKAAATWIGIALLIIAVGAIGGL